MPTPSLADTPKQITAIKAELDRRLNPKHRATGYRAHLKHVPEVKCADGFHMSVQASEFHYCSPRDSVGPKFSSVEVGFPSAKVESFMPYIDGGEDTDPTRTVYGYVPIGLVVQAIADHGGFATERGSA